MNPIWNKISHKISELVENVLRTRLLYIEDRYIGHLSTEIGIKVSDILYSRNYIVNHPERLNIPFETTGTPSHLTITAGTMTSADDSDARLTASTSCIQHKQPLLSPQMPPPRTQESIRTLRQDEEQRTYR